MIKKLKSFYQKNRVYSILMIISIICILSILFGVCFYFLGQTSKDIYGNRLEGIENIKIEESTFNEIKTNLLSSEKVENVTTELKGKLIYIVVSLKTGTHQDTETLAQTSLNTINENIKSYYDIQYIFKNNDENSNENFPVMGYIKANNSVIKWTKFEA